MIVIAPEQRAYFEARAGALPDTAQFIGRWNETGCLGVVAVWNYSGIDAETGWAGDRGWLTRSFLQIVFAYLFGQLGCRRISGRIECNNPASLDGAQRLGFKLEGDAAQCLRERRCMDCRNA